MGAIMRKAIVTGANGFVGLAICKELVKQETEVIAIIRENGDTRGLEELKGVRIYYCDLHYYNNLPKLFADRDIDCFYHLAWIGSAGMLRGDYEVQLDNIKSTCRAVEACEAIRCHRFVFASSIMEYEVEALMKGEKVPGINTLYSTSKLSANYMARTIANSKKIDYIRCVISNIYGPGEKSPRLINTSIRKMIKGEHCSFSEGVQIYDFIYIDDASRAMVAVGQRGLNNRTYYIGSLNPKPLREFLIEMRDSIDPTIEIGLGEIAFNGSSLTYKEFEIENVKNDTGVVPEVSFSEGIKRTIDWLRG